MMAFCRKKVDFCVNLAMKSAFFLSQSVNFCKKFILFAKKYVTLERISRKRDGSYLLILRYRELELWLLKVITNPNTKSKYGCSTCAQRYKNPSWINRKQKVLTVQPKGWRWWAFCVFSMRINIFAKNWLLPQTMPH